MEKAKVEEVYGSSLKGKKYYPVIRDVMVLKGELDDAVYLEINGMYKSFENGREWEFCLSYMAENQLQMDKLIKEHIGAGIGVAKLKYPVEWMGKDEDFDCMIRNARTSWACLQGYLIKQMERADPYGDMARVFRVKGLAQVFRAMGEVVRFSDMNNTERVESRYEHNIFMNRVKGFITEVFPYIPERLQKDEFMLASFLRSAVFGEKLWDGLYDDEELWRCLSDEGNIRRVEEDYYRDGQQDYQGCCLDNFLAVHYPRVSQDVKEALGKDAVVTLIRKGILHAVGYDYNMWKLPKSIEEDPEVAFEAVRAGLCSYGFPMPRQFIDNDSIIAEHIMTLYIKKLNEGYVYTTYDYPTPAKLAKGFEAELKCIAEDREKGEDLYELAEMVIKVYEENHHCRRGLKDLQTSQTMDVDSPARDNEALMERVRMLEEALREKEELETAVRWNNERWLNLVMTEAMPEIGVQGRLSGGYEDKNGSKRDFCLSSGGRLFYFGLMSRFRSN